MYMVSEKVATPTSVILLYMYNNEIFMYRVSEKVATPTSVILMATNTCVGKNGLYLNQFVKL